MGVGEVMAIGLVWSDLIWSGLFRVAIEFEFCCIAMAFSWAWI